MKSLTLKRQIELMLEQSSSRPDTVGIEAEYFAFDTATQQRIGGDKAISFKQLILQRFVDEVPLSITFEPGFQVEFAAGPVSRLTVLETTWHKLMSVCEMACHTLGICLVPLGFDPWSDRRSVPWNLTDRYHILKRFLASRGSGYRDMMTMTAGIHVNLDYGDSSAGPLKFVLWNLAAPILSAMFANSPFERRARNGFCSTRAATWLEVDATRVMVPDFVITRQFSPDLYSEYVATLPHIWQSDRPDNEYEQIDILQHLRTIYTPCRIKPNLIEIRSVDTGGLRHLLAAAAICKGASASEFHLRAALASIPRLTSSELLRAQQDAARDGLSAWYGPMPLCVLADGLLDIAADGLRNSSPEDVPFLEFAVDVCRRRACPADSLVAWTHPSCAGVMTLTTD